MNNQKNLITPEQLYVSRMTKKVVKMDDMNFKIVEVDKNPPSTGYPEIDSVAKLLAENDQISTRLVYACLGKDVLLGKLLFRKVTGLSIVSFIHKYRLLICCELLKCTNLQIKEIAKRLGCSQGQLTRDFNKEYKCTPLTYRNLYRPKHYEFLYQF